MKYATKMLGMMALTAMLVAGSTARADFEDDWDETFETYDGAQTLKDSNNSDVYQWRQECEAVMPFGDDLDTVIAECENALDDYELAQEDLDLCGQSLSLSWQAYTLYLSTNNQTHLNSAQSFLTDAQTHGINALSDMANGNAHRTAAWEVYEPYAP